MLLALPLVAASSVPSRVPPAFMFTWGWGVNDGVGEFQICQRDCQDGSDGDGIGQFDRPRGVAVEMSGGVCVVDSGNHRIQKFDSSGTYLNQWGGNGTGEGEFSSPNGAAVDSAGNVYVADTDNHRIQKFDSTGDFLLTWGWGVNLASLGFQICTKDCQAGVAGDGDGQFEYPFDVAVDSSGYVYVADSANHRIQKFDSGGTYLTQWGGLGTTDGKLSSPVALATDGVDDVYVAEGGAKRIQKFDSVGNFLRMWGWGVDDGTLAFQVCTKSCERGTAGSGDGQFEYPYGVAVDTGGIVYVSDNANNRVQMFQDNGTFLTKWGVHGNNEGQFNAPHMVAVDAQGNVYVADKTNHRIQKYAGPWLEIFVGEPEVPSGSPPGN
jgi:DNA-binding beta-propeller fold protein YncE